MTKAYASESKHGNLEGKVIMTPIRTSICPNSCCVLDSTEPDRTTFVDRFQAPISQTKEGRDQLDSIAKLY